MRSIFFVSSLKELQADSFRQQENMHVSSASMNRGIEIGYDVAYDESSWIQEEVRNGVAVRMALEYLTLTEGKDIEAGH